VESLFRINCVCFLFDFSFYDMNYNERRNNDRVFSSIDSVLLALNLLSTVLLLLHPYVST